MTIENLLKVVPPPASPVAAYGGPWEPIEEQLGTYLPQDYKDFVRLYGLGDFMQILTVFVPRAESPHIRLVRQAHVARLNFADDDDFEYAVWPEPGGILPCAVTDNGAQLAWVRCGAPANWNILVWGRGYGDPEVFDCDLTDFLAGMATGKITAWDFSEDPAIPPDRLFKPMDDEYRPDERG